MTGPHDALLHETAEDLFEEAPCGYLATDPDGRLLMVNRTFEEWTGHAREELLGKSRMTDLLGAGSRIYYETHYLPLLLMQGWVREIAIDVVRADGSVMPALVNAVLRRDEDGRPALIRTTVFDATDRRRYEDELRLARDHDRDVARRLQESLLAGIRMEDPRLAVGIRYLPSAAGLQVGGDWYDVFPLGGDRVALVVGDVVGRGLDAAATMGQLRSAVRALAATGLGPGALLGALDGFSERHGVGSMSTVAYAALDLREGTMCLACAGHVPPVLVEPGGAPRFVTDGRSVPLDVYEAPRVRPETMFRLAPGTLLVLYTDGLIERAGSPIVDGLDALLDRTARLVAAGEQPEALAHGLADAMLGERDATDDVCVLAARFASKQAS